MLQYLCLFDYVLYTMNLATQNEHHNEEKTWGT